MFEKYLQQIGLTEKEAIVYVALLQVEHNSALELAKRTDIKRPTVYVMLESLAKKGLVSETQVGKKVRYQAEPPERLKTYVERRKAELEEQEHRLDDVIPQLKSIQREQGERPVVKYYEGKDGVISSMEDFLSPQETAAEDKTMYVVYPRDLLSEVFSESERKKYRDRRLSKGIKTKSILTFKAGDVSSDNSSTRLKVDESKYPIYCDIGVYKDKVRIHTLSESLAGIFIKNKDFADTMRSLLNYIFDHSVKSNKKDSGV